MSTPRPDKSSLPDPSYHWTTLKARVFLGALADHGRVVDAAHAVGMCRQSAYRLRAQLWWKMMHPDAQLEGGWPNGSGQASCEYCAPPIFR